MKALFLSLKNLIRTVGVLINQPPAYLPPHCCNINALLLHLCDYDAAMHKWVLRWIAYPLRHPGAKMSTCLVFNGGEASGKSLFFERVVARLHGAFARQLHSTMLRHMFNEWAVGARMVIIDGKYARSMTPQLKYLVARSHIWVCAKGREERVELNQMNFVFLSGAIDFLPVSASDRRFIVVEVPPAAPPLFYRAVADEIDNGGVEAFLHYLVHELDMGDFDERTLPPARQVDAARREAA